jgi:hypothetical protein
MDADNVPLRQLSELFRQDVFQGVPPADMSDAEVCECFLTWLGVYTDDPVVRRLLDEAPAELRDMLSRRLLHHEVEHD